MRIALVVALEDGQRESGKGRTVMHTGHITMPRFPRSILAIRLWWIKRNDFKMIRWNSPTIQPMADSHVGWMVNDSSHPSPWRNRMEVWRISNKNRVLHFLASLTIQWHHPHNSPKKELRLLGFQYVTLSKSVPILSNQPECFADFDCLLILPRHCVRDKLFFA